MSSEANEPKNPVASLVGTAFLVLVPLALIVMLGIVGFAFVGGMKKEKKEEPAAPVAAAPAAPAALDPAVMELGKASFMLCAACHGPDGKGLQAGPALMAPSLVDSKVLLGDPDLPLLVVLKGIAKENMNFMGVMAPLAAGLDDEKLAAVLTYTRNSWGNSAPAVTVEQAAAARAKFADVDAPAGVKRSEIEAIVAAHKK